MHAIATTQTDFTESILSIFYFLILIIHGFYSGIPNNVGLGFAIN